MSYRKRRKYFVNSKFQLKFAFGFIIAALIGSLSSTALFNYLAMRKLEQLQWSVHISAQSTGEALQHIFVFVNLFGLVFVSILFGITGFKMLRKINGPIYRLIKSLESIQNGDLSKTIMLRHKDDFGNIAKNMEEMKEQIRKRFIDSKNQYDKISRAIQEMEKEIIKGAVVDEKAGKIILLIQKLQKENSNIQ